LRPSWTSPADPSVESEQKMQWSSQKCLRRRGRRVPWSWLPLFLTAALALAIGSIAAPRSEEHRAAPTLPALLVPPTGGSSGSRDWSPQSPAAIPDQGLASGSAGRSSSVRPLRSLAGISPGVIFQRVQVFRKAESERITEPGCRNKSHSISKTNVAPDPPLDLRYTKPPKQSRH
jgi:hypothetical protein